VAPLAGEINGWEVKGPCACELEEDKERLILSTPPRTTFSQLMMAGFITADNKGYSVVEIFKQPFCFFPDGTSWRLAHFQEAFKEDFCSVVVPNESHPIMPCWKLLDIAEKIVRTFGKIILKITVRRGAACSSTSSGTEALIHPSSAEHKARDMTLHGDQGYEHIISILKFRTWI
jgi:hypothetical protein